MRRKQLAKIAIYAFGLSVLSTINFVREASAFNNPDLLTRRIRATAIKGESIDQVLDRLSDEYGIAVGMELGDPKSTPRSEIDLNLPETNLKDFLDSVIAKDSRYTWKLEEGVIHVWPLTGRDTLVAALLDIKISHFSITGGTSRYRICYGIMDLPEIRSQLVIAGVEPMIFLSSGSMTKVGEATSFDETNLTLRELLDRIVLRTEMKQWVITRWGKNNEFITLRS